MVKEVTIADVVKHVMDVMEAEREKINLVIRRYESGNVLRDIILGDWKVIGAYPCITVEPSTDTPRWGATNYVQSPIYNVTITCYIKNIAKPVTVSYIIEFAETVKSILIHPSNLRFETDNGVVYDSFVTNVSYNVNEDHSIRNAKLNFQAVAWVSDIGIT